MNVFILEDDILQQQRLENLVRDVLLENKWVAKSLITTAKPHFLLEQINQTVTQNIYFLDIEIQGQEKKGLEISQKIRATDPNGIISFITTHSEFAPITYTYKVSAFDFINKDWSSEEIKTHIKSCFIELIDSKNRIEKSDLFVFETKHASFQVPFAEILYFETTEISHKLRLVCKSRLVNFYATLGEISAMDPRFYQVHRSFVVNLENVAEIERSEGLVYFDKEQTCMISRRKIKTALTKMKTLNEKKEPH